MAKPATDVTLSLDECDPNVLPPVCCKCGAEATCEKQVKFSWYPPWIIVTVLIAVLLAVILSLVLRKKRTAYLPVCDKHKGVWNWGGAIFGLAFGWLFLGIVACAVAFGGRNNPDVALPVCLVVAGLVLVGFIVGAVVQSRGIRPKRITDDELHLLNLNPDFVEAIEADRDREEDEYAARRDAKRAARGTA
jgi:hypothetical protein